jgi:hypothetical protein
MWKILKKLAGDSSGPAIPGLFAVGSWFVSQFFKVPFDAGIFRAGAVLGMLAGYALGNVYFASTPPKRAFIALTIALAPGGGVIVMVDYYFYVGGGHASGKWQTMRAVAELAFVFMCAGILMPIAGINFNKSEEDEGQTEI